MFSCPSTCREDVLPDGDSDQIMWYDWSVDDYCSFCCWSAKKRKVKLKQCPFFLENQTFWCIRFAVSLQKCISKSSRIFNPLSVFNLGPGRSEFSVTRHCSSGNLIRLDNNLFKGEEWTGPGAACDRRSFDHRTSSSEAVSLLWHLKQSHSFYVLTVGTANLDISLSI